jgi:hypothetical protein
VNRTLKTPKCHLCATFEVGETIRNGRSYQSLLDNGTFFFKEVYVPPTTTPLYGHLEPLPLP